jgi:hypothetical protein
LLQAEIKVLKEQIDLMWFPQQNAMVITIFSLSHQLQTTFVVPKFSLQIFVDIKIEPVAAWWRQALSRRPKTADEVLLEQVSQLRMRSAAFEHDLARRRDALAGQEALSFSVWYYNTHPATQRNLVYKSLAHQQQYLVANWCIKDVVASFWRRRAGNRVW